MLPTSLQGTLGETSLGERSHRWTPHDLRLSLPAPATVPPLGISMFVYFSFPWEHFEGMGHASFVQSWPLGLLSLFCHYYEQCCWDHLRTNGLCFPFDCCCCFFFFLLDFPKQTCPSKNRSSCIILMYLDGSVLDRDLTILLPTLIALTGFLLYLRGGHAPCCRGPFVASQSLRSRRAPTGLGSHQTTGSLWNKICDDSPLCLCLGR